MQDFLARCTATQRKFGLPPEGERAVLDQDRLVVTVPEGLSEGHTFTVVSDARKQVAPWRLLRHEPALDLSPLPMRSLMAVSASAVPCA